VHELGEERRGEERRGEERRGEERRGEERRGEKKLTPFGVNLMRSQVLYWAAQCARFTLRIE